jgi:co-chaperonin GroES (HSP10)
MLLDRGLLSRVQPDDPRADLRATVSAELPGIEIFNNQVLVVVYIRPEKTKGGIIRIDSTREEDKFQSKVGLIVKMGGEAFQDPEGKWFKDNDIGIDDWIVFRPSDGWGLTIAGKMCRVLDDTAVRARVDHPERVY